MNREECQIQCISCGKCRRNCEFLSQYELDFSQPEKLKELAYHCMLCGKCTQVCPIGIDGKTRIVDMRREVVREKQGKLDGYKVLRGEKVNYKFRNYRMGKKKSVLFLGCNYPSLYPKTTTQLMNLMKQNEIGIVFDCCGKPIGELGLELEAKGIIQGLEQRFQKYQIEELIVVCPNCYYYLKDKISIPIRTIYEKLNELGWETNSSMVEKSNQIFIPCPDRDDEKWLADIEVLAQHTFAKVEGVQCCGLGGVAPVEEPQYPKQMAKKLQEKSNGTYVYFESCAGSFRRNGLDNVEHILNVFVESKEQPDIKYSMINRMKCKLK